MIYEYKFIKENNPDKLVDLVNKAASRKWRLHKVIDSKQVWMERERVYETGIGRGLGEL